MKRLALAFAFALACACSSTPRELPPRGQILLHFDTDAPVPPRQGDVAPMAPLPLFDRLRVDVSACEDATLCPPVTRDFAVDVETLKAGQLSIGIAAIGKAPFVRARLFLFAESFQSEPPADVTIDVTAALPSIPQEGILERTLFLPTDAAGTSIRADVTEGAPASSAVGTWPGAQRVDCPAPPAEGEVCVPGGAFWIGSSRLRDFHLFLDPRPDARRLVVLSPFYLDAHEVTVGELRATHTTANPFSGSRDGNDISDWCTYTASPSANDTLAANCIKRSSAIAHCAALGKQLPSEAQLEWVASNLGRSLWPWGNDVPACADAVVARAYGPLDPGNFTDSPACRKKPVDGPLAGGTGARDRVDLPGAFGGSVVDLVGNVSEFTRDIFQFHDDDCWATPGVYRDPVCDHYGATPHGFLLKGGNFWWAQGVSFAALRFPVQDDAADPLWGFRCARGVP